MDFLKHVFIETCGSTGLETVPVEVDNRLQIAVSSFVSDSYMYVALIGPGEHLQDSFPYSRYNTPGAVKIKASSRGVIFYGL